MTYYLILVGEGSYFTYYDQIDISYVVQNLSQFMHKTKKSHIEGPLRVVRYLKNAPALGIILSGKHSRQLSVYCDADWKTYPMTRKSVSGFVVKLEDSLISWKSNMQNTILRSSTEAKYMIMDNVVIQVVW